MYQTELLGAYNFGNIAAAVAVGREFKVAEADIITAVCTYKPENQRSQIIEKPNVRVILDAYNANPTSMQAAIENLKRISGKRAVILGDMREVEDTKYKHEQVGLQVREADIAMQIFIGKDMKYAHLQCEGSYWFETADDFLAKNEESGISFPGFTVLVKASRSMRLEKVVDCIT